MSINLYLSATIDVKSEKGKKRKKLHLKESFDLYQTPTDVTFSILKSGNSGDIKNSYIEWVKQDEIANFHKPENHQHIDQLKKWLEQHREWEIDWYGL